MQARQTKILSEISPADTLESYLGSATRSGRPVYIGLALALTASLAALPFVRINVSVNAAGRIAVISPSSEIVAELFVASRDAGLLRLGTAVRVQVDAFEFAEWGFIAGHVTEVADDFVTMNQTPVVRVLCALERDSLMLPNGAVGHVKKGMTLRAHFVIARRSLAQLLWDNLSDWADPRQGPERRT